MWNKGDWVVVVGGTFDRDGKIRDVSFQIASIVEIGLDDLLVKPKEHYSMQLKFVPKKTCQKIPVGQIQVYDETRKPECGDLVYYHEKSWNKNLVTSVSHVLELRIDQGRGVSALILIGDKQDWVDIKYLLVLDVNNASE